ncbi:arylamine N-acetyltransferase family protein [Solirubrum puertoriconensis]|uniref:Acetyltransferase n=1 Tax=Solirubrum puertoriconensis TaxID=1751427 RepID=A0A9X0HMZ9_SOLP1|nr:arylamine N-acetyltransferase [Solirubrum puertoriconensis]KUG09026.1 acetyltransferase [Solirubrum puertoriconensis]
MNVNQYLTRIQYSGIPRVDLATLEELHLAHLLSVPFENLSIHYGQPIVLDLERVFRKVVEHRRGGFCYELNSLFGWLLQQIGFNVILISAEVCQKDGTFSPPYDHLALLVELDETWLADVGFGDSFRLPLRLNEPGPQRQGATAYQISREGEYYLLRAQNLLDREPHWETQYRFTRQPHPLTDFAGMCHYHQTSPESHFTQKRVCSRATPEGRITLSDQRLIVTRGSRREETVLESEEEFLRALQTHFAITLQPQPHA